MSLVFQWFLLLSSIASLSYSPEEIAQRWISKGRNSPELIDFSMDLRPQSREDILEMLKNRNLPYKTLLFVIYEPDTSRVVNYVEGGQNPYANYTPQQLERMRVILEYQRLVNKDKPQTLENSNGRPQPQNLLNQPKKENRDVLEVFVQDLATRMFPDEKAQANVVIILILSKAKKAFILRGKDAETTISDEQIQNALNAMQPKMNNKDFDLALIEAVRQLFPYDDSANSTRTFLLIAGFALLALVVLGIFIFVAISKSKKSKQTSVPANQQLYPPVESGQTQLSCGHYVNMAATKGVCPFCPSRPAPPYNPNAYPPANNYPPQNPPSLAKQNPPAAGINVFFVSGGANPGY